MARFLTSGIKCMIMSSIRQKFCKRSIYLSSATHSSSGAGFHRPSDFDKKILVWSKMYPDVSVIPDEITQVQMKKAKDKCRIKANLIMIAMTLVACVFYALSGRRAAQRGESVSKQNKLWHDQQKFSKE